MQVEVASLLAHYRVASETDRLVRGRNWYPTMGRIMRKLAAETGYTPEQATAVLAVTSPNVQLKTNLDWTVRALRERGTGRYGCYPTDMTSKVRDILAGDCSRCSGPKVSAFSAAVLGDADALVIDRWATFAATGSQKLSASIRRTVEAAYREAARITGESVSALQAIVWLQVRETTPDARGRIRRFADIV